MSLRRMQPLAPPHLPHQVRLAYHLMARNIFPIAHRVSTINRLAVHLGQQNVGDGAYHRIRRTFQQIGKPYQKPALAQANRIINVSEGKKFNL